MILNHKAAADHTETFTVVEVSPEDRTELLSEHFEIEGWTNFTFAGRHKTYNDFEWHWYHLQEQIMMSKLEKLEFSNSRRQ